VGILAEQRLARHQQRLLELEGEQATLAILEIRLADLFAAKGGITREALRP
jgi:hypothetical protein